jgi:hypothetical protein
LLKLLPELKDKLEILLDKYTKIEKVERSPALRVKIPEASGPSIWQKIEELGSKLLNVFKSWGQNYDKKLQVLKDELNEFISDIPVEESLEDDSEEPSQPDYDDVLYMVNESYGYLKDAYSKLLRTEIFIKKNLSGHLIEEAEKIKELSYEVERVQDKVKLFHMDLEEKLKVVDVKLNSKADVKEEIQKEPEHMQLELAKKIRKYLQDNDHVYYKHDPDDASKQQISKMLFQKDKVISALSLFEILSALQELTADQYMTLKQFFNSIAPIDDSAGKDWKNFTQ